MQQWKRGALSAALVTLAACGGSGGSSGGGLNTGPTGGTTGHGWRKSQCRHSDQPAVCAGDTHGQQGRYRDLELERLRWLRMATVVEVCVTHGVVFDDGSDLVSPVQSSGVWTRIFSDTGTFNYHCSVHLTAMTGVIKVQ